VPPPKPVGAIDGEEDGRLTPAPQLPQFVTVNEVDRGAGSVEEGDAARGIGGFEQAAECAPKGGDAEAAGDE
jgi:hypothetical protein